MVSVPRKCAHGHLIGGAGVNSTVRHAMFPDHEIAGARSSEDCFYLVNLSEEQLKANNALNPYLDHPFMAAWLGPSHFMLVNTVGRHFMSHAVLSAKGGGEVGEWNDTITLEGLQAKFAGFGPVAKGITSAGHGCYKWKIAEVGPLPTWTEGKTVLLGDAAHAMYPTRGQVRLTGSLNMNFMLTRGQGATQSLEDAACLGECINAAKSTEDISAVLAIYEKQRRNRVHAVAASAKGNMKEFTMPDGPGQEKRDQKLREGEKKGLEAAQDAKSHVNLKANDVPEEGLGFDIWLARYDVFKDTRDAPGIS